MIMKVRVNYYKMSPYYKDSVNIQTKLNISTLQAICASLWLKQNILKLNVDLMC